MIANLVLFSFNKSFKRISQCCIINAQLLHINPQIRPLLCCIITAQCIATAQKFPNNTPIILHNYCIDTAHKFSKNTAIMQFLTEYTLSGFQSCGANPIKDNSQLIYMFSKNFLARYHYIIDIQLNRLNTTKDIV